MALGVATHVVGANVADVAVVHVSGRNKSG